MNIKLNPQPITQALQDAFETQFNIFTLRFTFPLLHEDEYMQCMKKMFKAIDKLKQYKYSVTFKEYSKRKVLHFHSRIVVTYKTPNMLRNFVKSFFPENAKGNKFFSVHRCWVDGILHDKSLCKSSNYIAKDGHIVHYFGYTKSQIKELIQKSYEYNKMLKMPMHEKLIQLYDIDCAARIVPAIMDFYESVHKIPPKTHIIQDTIRKILFKISPGYRTHYAQQLELYIQETTSW